MRARATAIVTCCYALRCHCLRQSIVVGDTFGAPSDGTPVARSLLLRVFWAGSQLPKRADGANIGIVSVGVASGPSAIESLTSALRQKQSRAEDRIAPQAVNGGGEMVPRERRTMLQKGPLPPAPDDYAEG